MRVDSTIPLRIGFWKRKTQDSGRSWSTRKSGLAHYDNRRRIGNVHRTASYLRSPLPDALVVVVADDSGN